MWDPTPNLPEGYGGLLILVAFVGAMVWIVWLARRRSQFEGVNEVSANEQARLAQEARAMYVGPEFRLCNIETPSEFDSHLLSLFDSIEANRDDIDAKLENLRIYLKSNNMFERLKNKQKLRLVYGNMAAYLVRPRPGQSRLGMRQLLANWGKLGRLAGGEGPSPRVPETWIRPLVNDFVPALSSTGNGTSRKASSTRVDFAALIAVASLVLFVLSVVFGFGGLSPYGLPSGAFFAAGCVFLVLAIVFRRRRPRE
jgi:hypothetical protein